MKTRISIILGGALLGATDAGYLWYERITGGTLECPITGEGCATVQASPYAAPGGIPIAAVGFIGYLAIATMCVLILTNRNLKGINSQKVLGGLLSAALLASIVLVGVQAFLIQAYCFWCLVSALNSLIMFATMFTPASWFAKQKQPVKGRQRGRAAVKRSHRGLLIGGAVVLVLLVVLSLLFSTSSVSQQATIPVQAAANIDLNYPTKGDSKAPVKVIVYSDYQCPACAAFATTTELEFDRAYVQTGKAWVEFRDFPLPQHNNAIVAAQVAHIAGDQGKYWPMHDLIFARQAEWSNVSDPTTLFVSYAKSIGLDEKAFRRDLQAGKYFVEVTESGRQAMAAKVNGTPTVLVNGKKISWSELSQAVEAALAAASTTR